MKTPAFRPEPRRARAGLHLGLALLGLFPVLRDDAMAAEPASVFVEAGLSPRTNTLVSFPWSGDSGARLQLVSRGDPGVRIPVQIADGRAWFVEPGLGAGESRRYRLDAVPATTAESSATAVRDGDDLALRLHQRTAAHFIAGPGALPRADIKPEFKRGGYLHPVLTPAGHVVTDDYAPNHIHQHGLWFSWTKTEFEDRKPDFWNMGLGTGRTDFEALDSVESGPVFASFRSRQGFTDLLAKPARRALEERWTVRLLALGKEPRFHAFDLMSEQHCAGAAALALPKYHYGGFAFRGLWAWNDTNQLAYLDSLGCRDRIAANETRPNWFWMGGPSSGPGSPIVGLVQFGHPANFRAPQPVRVHPNEPYACWAPSQLGDWAIRPGETYVSRYRILALDGAPDPALLNRLWADYSAPPKVTRE